jgi:molybdenum-dependent DNA-binding transcriptional regulator ModE
MLYFDQNEKEEPKMLRLRQLEALSAVITTGSISGAAKTLGISQPAMSRLIADLSKNFEFNYSTNAMDS